MKKFSVKDNVKLSELALADIIETIIGIVLLTMLFLYSINLHIKEFNSLSELYISQCPQYKQPHCKAKRR